MSAIRHTEPIARRARRQAKYTVVIVDHTIVSFVAVRSTTASHGAKRPV